MDVSFIIVNWNTKKLLLDCLNSIYETVKDIDFEIFLVDNASTDGSVQAVHRAFPEVKTIQNDRNLGFAAANNKAIKKMTGRYALLLNTDTILTDDAIYKLFQFIEKTPSVGMACGQLLNEDGTKQNSIANYPTILQLVVNSTLLRLLYPKRYPSKYKEYSEPIEVESCIGACMVVRKEAIDNIGLLDEDYFFYMEETDWALRFSKKGWKIYFVPDAKIFHLQGQSAGYNPRARMLYYKSRSIFFKKWRPNFHFPMQLIVFIKLLINILLNGIAVFGTFGLKASYRKKIYVYSQLIIWQLKGCPPIKS